MKKALLFCASFVLSVCFAEEIQLYCEWNTFKNFVLHEINSNDEARRIVSNERYNTIAQEDVQEQKILDQNTLRGKKLSKFQERISENIEDIFNGKFLTRIPKHEDLISALNIKDEVTAELHFFQAGQGDEFQMVSKNDAKFNENIPIAHTSYIYNAKDVLKNPLQIKTTSFFGYSIQTATWPQSSKEIRSINKARFVARIVCFDEFSSKRRHPVYKLPFKDNMGSHEYIIHPISFAVMATPDVIEWIGIDKVDASLVKHTYTTPFGTKVEMTAEELSTGGCRISAIAGPGGSSGMLDQMLFGNTKATVVYSYEDFKNFYTATGFPMQDNTVRTTSVYNGQFKAHPEGVSWNGIVIRCSNDNARKVIAGTTRFYISPNVDYEKKSIYFEGCVER